VTDPADAELAGEDRKEMRAPAAMAIEAGDTRAAVPLLIDGVTGQLRTFERLAPVIRPPPPPPITCSQLGQIRVPVAIASEG
jgi:hypothetical protein